MSPTVTSQVRSDQAGRKPLGFILLTRSRIRDEHLEEALALQRQRSEPIGELLCQLGYADAGVIREALVEQAAVPVVNLETTRVDPEALSSIPSDLAIRHKVLPFARRNGTLCLAMADPFDRVALDEIRVLSGNRIERYYCPEAELRETAQRLFGSNVARMIADLDGDNKPIASEQDVTTQLQELAREPSIVNLVNLIILEGIDARASDIHVEPFEKILKVKYRIDGILHEMSPPSKRLYAAIVSRIKIMADMDIAERFVPQDGHIGFTTAKGKVDIRVATVPTVFGECVVMRILDRSATLIGLEQVGLQSDCLEMFRSLLSRPHGIVLVTGPTGSGKTTTLYAALNRIYTEEKKIITIEDPVEYQLEGVNQIAVNRKRGIDFASGLRAIVRQDPDIIMVGEIRDRETADIAIRSALTGHLVFSTLHTNDAGGAVTRLLDMGIEPFLLASSLEGVLAQRLVRKICPHCRDACQPEPALLARIGRDADAHGATFFRGHGCRHCRQSGYFGRTGIFELLRITQPVREAMLRRASAAEIAERAPADHRPLRQDGFDKAAAGITTLEEVLRVTQDTQTEEAMS